MTRPAASGTAPRTTSGRFCQYSRRNARGERPPRKAWGASKSIVTGKRGRQPVGSPDLTGSEKPEDSASGGAVDAPVEVAEHGAEVGVVVEALAVHPRELAHHGEHLHGREVVGVEVVEAVERIGGRGRRRRRGGRDVAQHHADTDGGEDGGEERAGNGGHRERGGMPPATPTAPGAVPGAGQARAARGVVVPDGRPRDDPETLPGPSTAPKPGAAPCRCAAILNPLPAMADAKYLTATDQNFQAEVMDSDKPVLVDFWAAWCGPCRAIAPSIEQLAAEYEGKAVIAKVDVDANPMISQQFGVRSIPTLLFIQNGVVVDQLVGGVPKKMLAAKLDALVAQAA